MKKVTKRLISNETSQDRSIRLKNAANRSANKISNETLQKRSIRLKNANKGYAAIKSSETSSERASRLEKSRRKAKTTAGKIKLNGIA
jgi:hypothetical protein